MNKVRRRAQLLKDFRKTGDEDYRIAAEALQVPLLDQIKQLDLYPGRRRGPSIAKEARPRLYRMHRAIRSGASVLATAKQEVARHGHRPHASEDAAVDYLRSKYAEHRKEIAEISASGERIAATHRQFERTAAQLNRAIQVALPPDWILNSHKHHALAPLMRSLDTLTRMAWHPLLSWRNTRLKAAEKRSNDKVTSV